MSSFFIDPHERTTELHVCPFKEQEIKTMSYFDAYVDRGLKN